MSVAVAGGTGVLGTLVVDALRTRGEEVVVLARSHGVDARSGTGLDAALDGIDVVVDALSVATTSAEASVAFFSTTTRALLAAEHRAGIGHHLAISIVGIDRSEGYGYYAGKLAQERLIADGAVPWTILRATQFHEFAVQMLDRARVGPLHVAPRARTQPVAAREVATRLAELAVAIPSGRVADLAGPREESLADMVRAYARATGHRGWIPAVSLPGGFGRAMRDGSLLPGPGADLGTQTFAEWIAAIGGPGGSAGFER